MKRRFVVYWYLDDEHVGRSKGRSKVDKLGFVTMARIESVVFNGGTVHILQRDRNPWNQERCA